MNFVAISCCCCCSCERVNGKTHSTIAKSVWCVRVRSMSIWERLHYVIGSMKTYSLFFIIDKPHAILKISNNFAWANIYSVEFNCAVYKHVTRQLKLICRLNVILNKINSNGHNACQTLALCFVYLLAYLCLVGAVGLCVCVHVFAIFGFSFN